jgi:hypothetical protein
MNHAPVFPAILGYSNRNRRFSGRRFCFSFYFMRPRTEAQFHPAGIIFSIVEAALVLFPRNKLNRHLSS